jgi:hypothetical protein
MTWPVGPNVEDAGDVKVVVTYQYLFDAGAFTATGE